jgi:hypothetical protein
MALVALSLLDGVAQQLRALAHLLHCLADQLAYLLGSFGAALRQRTHLTGHDGKAAPCSPAWRPPRPH